MKICYINGRFLTQAATGVQRYAEELVKALDILIETGAIDASDISFTLLTPQRTRKTLALKHIEARHVGRLSGHLWEQIDLPRYTRDGFLINLCNTAPLFKRHQMVTIHDAGIVVMPGAYSYAFRTWYRLVLSRLGKTAERVITVSDFSKNELIRHFGIPADKILPIHHGRQHIDTVSADDYIIERAELNRRPFLLAVSSLNLRKNFHAVLLALEKLGTVDFDIVIAGGANPKVFGSRYVNLPKHIRYLGYVTDGELKSLYHHAAAFIYPSLYEGFGLPPLEAMTCGCPVIVSDIPPHREVCGDGAIYCNPNSPDDIARKITIVMTDPDLRRRLVADGKKRAKGFSWQKTADTFYHALDNLIHTG